MGARDCRGVRWAAGGAVDARDARRRVGRFWMLPDLFFSSRRARALELSELVCRNCPVRLRRRVLLLGADVLIVPLLSLAGTYTLNNYTAAASATGVSSTSFATSSSMASDGRPLGTKIKTSNTGAK